MERVTLVDLETTLLQDERGEVLSRFKERLLQDRHRVRQSIETGLPPGDFLAAEKWIAACDAATRILDSFWRGCHETNRNRR